MKFILPAIIMFVMSVGVKKMCPTSNVSLVYPTSTQKGKKLADRVSITKYIYVTPTKNYVLIQ